jgi:hypothetical protein
MPSVTLTKTEIAILRNAARKGDADAGYHELLLTLDSLLDESTGGLFLSQSTLDLIQRYGAGGCAKLSWQGTLHSIFVRSLGEALGRKRDDSGRLIQTEAPKPKDLSHIIRTE